MFLFENANKIALTITINQRDYLVCGCTLVISSY